MKTKMYLSISCNHQAQVFFYGQNWTKHILSNACWGAIPQSFAAFLLLHHTDQVPGFIGLLQTSDFSITEKT